MGNGESDKLKVIAIVPAAGRSRRMGKAKQLLDVRGKPMVAAVVEAIALAGIDSVVVLNQDIVKQLQNVPATILINDDPQSHMIDSIRMGMKHRVADGFLICPADQATIRPQDVRSCVDAFLQHPDCIVVASHGSKHGHPTIVPADLETDVNSSVCDRGLNQLLRAYPQRVVEVECSAAATENVNTPEDYKRVTEQK